MGQRLVVRVVKNQMDIAGMYFHWSAYTISALEITREIIDAIYDEEDTTEDIRLKLIRYCEKNGGCIDGGKGSAEWNYITGLYPNETFKEDGSRNCGLIALSENGIDEMEGWSEGDVIIDLDNEIVFNYVVFSYFNIDEYNEMRVENEEEPMTLEDITDVGNIEEFRFYDIDDIIMTLNSFNSFVCRSGNVIYELIA